MKLRALDLFCGAGGTGMGLYRAGFDVVGVDIKPQPRYPAFHDAPHAKHFSFHQADAMTFPLEGFDFIWASPPCQAYSDMRAMPTAKQHAALIDPVRERLMDAGIPWVIENVEGAPLLIGPPSLFWKGTGIILCGSMFGLANDIFQLRRHRLFEASFSMRQPACMHTVRPVVGFYGDHAQIRNRRPGSRDRGTQLDGERAQTLARELMHVDWMNRKEVCQAIPPSYAEFIARQFLDTCCAAPRSATSNAVTEGHSHRPGG